MASILLWIGIALTVIGWVALASQAAKRMAIKDDLERFPIRKNLMQLRRNYCWLTIIASVALILIAVII